MAFLSKVTNLISFALNKVQLKEEAEIVSISSESSTNQNAQYLKASWRLQSEPLDHASFSLVDSLMAKAAYRAVREMSETGDDVFMSEADIDLTDVVLSIESQNEQSSHNTSFSVNGMDHDQPVNADNGVEISNDSLDLRAKYKLQKAHCLDMMYQGWEQDTVLAYLKLDRRGFEPLFPSSWKMDFVLFPPILFTDDEGTAFVRSLNGKNWRAVHEFDNFCKAGLEVRVSQLHHTHPARRPEALLARYIKQYMKWAWLDGDLSNDVDCGHLPHLLTVMCAKHDEKDRHDRAELLQERLLHQLRSSGDDLLAMMYSRGDRDEVLPSLGMPSLFGFAVVDSLVGVIAYEPLTRTARSIGFFNFDDRHVEIMNTISLTIIIHWVRNSSLRLQHVIRQSSARMNQGRSDRNDGRACAQDDIDIDA